MAGELTSLSLAMGRGVVSPPGPPQPYTPTGTLLAGFEATNEWTQPFSPQRTVSLDPVNKVQGNYALKYSPNSVSASGPLISKVLPSFDPLSLKAYAFYVKLPSDIALQSVDSITAAFRVNAGGTLYNGASATQLANLQTDGLWLSGNVSQLNATFQNAGVGNHDIRITCAETDAYVAEVSFDALYMDVLANEPAPVILTFDDAKVTQSTIVMPDLVANGLKGVIYPPSERVEAGGADIMTKAQIKAWYDAGLAVGVNGTPSDNVIPTDVEVFKSGLISQTDWLKNVVGVANPKGEFPWPFGYMREAPGQNNRFVAFNVNIPSGTNVLPLAPRSSDVTISIGSPAVVTWTAHPLKVGSKIKFSTTGALPTGIVAGTPYYVVTAGFSANSFRISATKGGSALNTSGSQSGTQTATAVFTDGVAIGQRAVMVGVSDNCRVTAVNPDVSVTLSEPMTIAASGANVAFVDDSNTQYGNKFVDAAASIGYLMARAAASLQRRVFVGFGFSRRLGLQFPAYGGNGATAASLLALVDIAIQEKAAICFYFHGITAGEFPPSEWALFVAGIKARQDAGLIKTYNGLSEINDRYFSAGVPA